MACDPEVNPGGLPGEGEVGSGPKGLSPIAEPMGVSGVCCKTWPPVYHSSSCSASLSPPVVSVRLTCT